MKLKAYSLVSSIFWCWAIVEVLVLLFFFLMVYKTYEEIFNYRDDLNGIIFVCFFCVFTTLSSLINRLYLSSKHKIYFSGIEILPVLWRQIHDPQYGVMDTVKILGVYFIAPLIIDAFSGLMVIMSFLYYKEMSINTESNFYLCLFIVASFILMISLYHSFKMFIFTSKIHKDIFLRLESDKNKTIKKYKILEEYDTSFFVDEFKDTISICTFGNIYINLELGNIVFDNNQYKFTTVLDYLDQTGKDFFHLDSHDFIVIDMLNV